MSTLYPVALTGVVAGPLTIVGNLHPWDPYGFTLGLGILALGVLMYRAESEARRKTKQSTQQKLTDYTNDQ